MASIIYIIALAIVVEAVTEIIVDSQLSYPLRNALKRAIYPTDRVPPNTLIHNSLVFLDKLLSCGYCTSVWVSAFFVLSMPVVSIFSSHVMSYIVSIFLVHRISNWVHVIYELVRKGRVITHDYMINLNQTQGKSDGST